MTEPNMTSAIMADTPRARRQLKVMVGWRIGETYKSAHPHFLPLLVAEARKRSWRLIGLENENWRLATQGKLHGALVEDLPGSPLVEDLRQSGCALIRFGRYPHPDDRFMPAVLPDIEAEGRLAAQHFADRGFLRVAYMRHKHAAFLQKMYDSFCAEAQRLGMNCSAFHTDSFRTSSDTRSERENQRRNDFVLWLEQQAKPLGMFLPGDSAAIHLTAGIMAAGLRIPDEVAILSRGNAAAECESLFPSLSSIDPNTEERLHVACNLLTDLLAGKQTVEESIVVAPKGVAERESTNTLGVADPGVASAIRYIWNNLDRDISVADVAAAVGIQRRKLERAFRIHLDRGINAELLRKRLEVLADLLLSTDETLARLGPEVGFRQSSHLHRAFKRAYGMSPQQYRKAHRTDPAGAEAP